MRRVAFTEHKLREGLEGIPDVDLWATCDRNAKIREPKVDEFLYEIKDKFASRGNPRTVGAFVKSIRDKIDETLAGKGEYVLYALRQSDVTWLSHAVVVWLIEVGECISERIGTSEVDHGGLVCRYPEGRNKNMPWKLIQPRKSVVISSMIAEPIDNHEVPDITRV
jgi:hypothetical protein